MRKRTRGDWMADLGTIAGKRRTVCAPTKIEAQQKAVKKLALLEQAGASALELSAYQIAEAACCINRLQLAFNGTVSLTDATDFYFTHRPSATEPVTVSEAHAAHIASQIARGLRDKSIASSRTIIRPFIEAYADRQIDAVSNKDVEQWLAGQNFTSAVTKGNVIRYLSVFFNYCREQGMIQDNPVDRIAKPKVTVKMPEFLPVEEVDRVFRWAVTSNHEECLPRLALGFFCGIRSAELDRLQWSDINLREGFVTIRPDVAKTGTPRHVTLSPNCIQWLSLPSITGTVCVTGKQLSRAIDTSDWPHNAMRHSFASYHLGLHQDPGKTAFELGHRGDPSLLYRHYRGLATKADAERFWAIAPKVGTNVIRMVG